MRKLKKKYVVIAALSLIFGIVVGVVKLPQSEAFNRIKASYEIKKMSDEELMDFVRKMGDEDLVYYVTSVYKPEAEKVFKYYFVNEIQKMEEEDVFPEVIEK